MHPLLFEYVMLLEYVSYSCIFLFRNGGYPTLWLCWKAMFTRTGAKRPGQEVWDHIRHVMWVLTRYVGDRPNNCLESDYNWVVFVLLTLKGDPEWRYRVDELLPRARDPHPWRSYCWCDWEPVGIDMEDLLDYLRMEGPHDLDYLQTARKEDTPPQVEELTKDEGDYRDVKSAPVKVSSEEG